MSSLPPGIRAAAWAAGTDGLERTALKFGIIPLRITSYNVCYTKLLRQCPRSMITISVTNSQKKLSPIENRVVATLYTNDTLIARDINDIIPGLLLFSSGIAI